MHSMDSESPLGGALVHKIEGYKNFVKNVLGLDEEKVRKLRIELTQAESNKT